MKTLALLVCLLLTGCAIPTKAHMDIATGWITTTEVGYTIPATGVVVSVSDVDSSMAGLGFLGWAGIILGGTTALTSVFPKGQAIWKMLFTGGVPFWSKVQGAAALPIPVLNSPPEAHAITAKTAVRNAKIEVATAKTIKAVKAKEK